MRSSSGLFWNYDFMTLIMNHFTLCAYSLHMFEYCFEWENKIIPMAKVIVLQTDRRKKLIFPDRPEKKETTVRAAPEEKARNLVTYLTGRAHVFRNTLP